MKTVVRVKITFLRMIHGGEIFELNFDCIAEHALRTATWVLRYLLNNNSVTVGNQVMPY